jgi:hypothetical protein
MHRFLLICFLLFIATGLKAQFVTNVFWTDQTDMPVNQTIYFNPSKLLLWNDFRGVPNQGGNVAAITSSGFGYKASMKSNGSKGQLNIAVYCYFSKDKSWVKPDKKTAYILNHEQHHFNISYIAASIFVDKLKRSNITASNCNSLLPKIYQECCDIMNKMQDDYDGQTHNGQVKEVQAKWNSYLTEKLNFTAK